MQNYTKLLIVGGGKMGYSIAKGTLEAKIYSEQEITVAEPNQNNLKILQTELGCNLITSASEIKSAELLIFAVKPFIAEAVLAEYKQLETKYVASVMAGVKITVLKKYFPNNIITRIMPNTPSLISKGATAFIATTAELDQLIDKIFSALGVVVKLDSEEKINIVTAISGSGPGFVYEFARQFISFAVKKGLTQVQAEELVRGTFYGSGAMLSSQTKQITELIADVATKGGTTAAGLDKFSQLNLDKTIFLALNEAYQKAISLGNNNSK